MELTRRDAITALVGGGIIASTALSDSFEQQADVSLSEDETRLLVDIAEVLYPTAVDPSDEFVETYVVGRYDLTDDHISGLREALELLRQASERETGRAFASLDRPARDSVLRSTGADRSLPDPNGTVAQRVRYYVINELLYALYTSPIGGELVGNPNPTGYPGGIEGGGRDG